MTVAELLKRLQHFAEMGYTDPDKPTKVEVGAIGEVEDCLIAQPGDRVVITVRLRP